MSGNNNTYNQNTGLDVLKEFQLAELPISEKQTKEFGLKVAKKIWGYSTTGIGGFFNARNAQFAKNRNYANGRIDGVIGVPRCLSAVLCFIGSIKLFG